MKKAVFVSVLMLVSTLAVAQGRLLGLITDDQGNPLRAAVVSLSNSDLTQAAVSNASGYYAFISVPLGSYTLKVSKSGLPQVSSSVTFEASIMKRLDVRLASAAPADLAEAKRAKPEPKDRRPEPAEKKPADLAKAEPAAKPAETKLPQPKPAPVPEKPAIIASTDTSLAANSRLKEALQDAEDAEKSEKLTLETKPEIIGGMNALYEKLIYPSIAREQKIEGDVVAKVFVDRNGFASKVTLVKTANAILNDEVFRVLSEDLRFKPATVGGKPIAGVVTILVTFRTERSLLPLQAAMFTKIFGYEKLLAQKPKVKIGVVYAADADIDGNELVKQFQTAKTEAEFVPESKLAETAKAFDVLYLLPSVNAKSIQAIALKAGVLTVTSTERFVEQGLVSVAIGTDEQGKSKIIVNRKNLEREQKSFNDALMKLATVVE